MIDRADTGQLGGIIRDIARPRGDVWALLTEPKYIRQWFWDSQPETDVQFTPDVGTRWKVSTGPASMGGQILAVVPSERITYTLRWTGDDRTHEVDIRLLDDPVGGTTVEISESGFASTAEQQVRVAGWNASLNLLAKTTLA
ncbi:SRPBCC family protein [Paramicrobacterium sp. CJ85]|uniref:SRPBCC family protein n=1 Tax=Paramicrobacterium sp. CJ85 TaxID=3445355 RepID=UPI003F5FF850